MYCPLCCYSKFLAKKKIDLLVSDYGKRGILIHYWWRSNLAASSREQLHTRPEVDGAHGGLHLCSWVCIFEKPRHLAPEQIWRRPSCSSAGARVNKNSSVHKTLCRVERAASSIHCNTEEA